MREMKDSGVAWIGEIPVDWKIARAKYCIIISNGSNPQTEGNIPVYGSGAESFRTCGEYKNGPTVLVGRKGTLNAPQYVEGKYWNVDTAFDVKAQSKYNLRFYYYAAYCFDYASCMSKTAQPGITQTSYRNMGLPMPSLKRQKQIAVYLDTKCAKIDAIIAKQKQVIEKLKAYKLSVITEAVTKGLNPNAPMKDSGIEWMGFVPEHWVISTLRNALSDLQTGPFGSQLHAEDYIENGIFVVNPANIVNGVIVPDPRCSVSDKKAYELKQHILIPGDIVFARRGEMGRCACIPANSNRYFCGTGCIRLKCNTTVKPQFAIDYLQTPYIKQYLELHSIGTTMSNLNSHIIAGIPMLFPPIGEQEDIHIFISNKSDTINRQIEKRLTLINKLTAYKKSLIYEVVTGKKEFNT